MHRFKKSFLFLLGVWLRGSNLQKLLVEIKISLEMIQSLLDMQRGRIMEISSLRQKVHREAAVHLTQSHASKNQSHRHQYDPDINR